MFKRIKNHFRMKNVNYQKELCRGTIKQIMKVRGLRTISLANYYNWKNSGNPDASTDSYRVHSLKIDIQDGYLNAFAFKPNSVRCGAKIEDASVDIYTEALNVVNEILNNERKIPTAFKKNILVKMSR